jgi:hypothetical protein
VRPNECEPTAKRPPTPQGGHYKRQPLRPIAFEEKSTGATAKAKTKGKPAHREAPANCAGNGGRYKCNGNGGVTSSANWEIGVAGRRSFGLQLLQV